MFYDPKKDFKKEKNQLFPQNYTSIIAKLTEPHPRLKLHPEAFTEQHFLSNIYINTDKPKYHHRRIKKYLF